jgi:hypothetical protein
MGQFAVAASMMASALSRTRPPLRAGRACLGSSLRELAFHCDAMYFGVESETF